jgi:hypothetical protein
MSAKALLLSLCICMILLLPGGAQAQRSEFGAGIGAMNYAGDLARGYQPGYMRPGGLLFYKMNFDPIVAVRFAVTGGALYGSDEEPIDAFATQREASFSTFVLEGSAVLEYNFLNFKSEKSLTRWSPYLFFGIAAFGDFGEKENGEGGGIQPAIPFGIGAKYILNPRFLLNFEAGVRKTFYDHLDGVSDGDQTNKNYQYGNKYDTDWYNFIGLSISYTLFDIPCPFDYR